MAELAAPTAPMLHPQYGGSYLSHLGGSRSGGRHAPVALQSAKLGPKVAGKRAHVRQIKLVKLNVLTHPIYCSGDSTVDSAQHHVQATTESQIECTASF